MFYEPKSFTGRRFHLSGDPLQAVCQGRAYDLFHVETGKDAKEFINNYKPQLVILDLKLPDTTGEEILDWIMERQFQTSVIIATAHGSVNTAVTLLQKRC